MRKGTNKVSIILKGRPITKKTGQRKFRYKILQKQIYLDYEEDCLWQIKIQYKGEMIKEQVSLRANYYMPDNRGRPDLINLLQGTCDILQKARVISNDRNIVLFNGSKIVGIDKENPRVEIEIKKAREN